MTTTEPSTQEKKDRPCWVCDKKNLPRARSLHEAAQALLEAEEHYNWLCGRGSLSFPEFDYSEKCLEDARWLAWRWLLRWQQRAPVH